LNKKKKEMKKNREKWVQKNSLYLYKIFFLDFSTENFHSIGLILEHLETIFFYNKYDEELVKFYLEKV
jgi:hypothetical protein